MKNEKFYEAIASLEREKSIPREYMYDKIKTALCKSIKREKNIPEECIDCVFNEEKRTIKVFTKKTVVEEVVNPNTEISLEDAHHILKKYKLGDTVEKEVDPAAVSRIAAKIGKNVIVQAIQDAMKSSIVNDFMPLMGTIITGKVTRIESNRTAFLRFKKYEIPLLSKEQLPGETFRVGDSVKVLVKDIRHTSNGQDITITRIGEEFIRQLFAIEVPEIEDGTVEIVKIAREPGSRTKIALRSDPSSGIDPVGACIGQGQGRINAILSNLKSESIDLIKYYDDEDSYIVSSLSPAQVTIEDIDYEGKKVKVSVPADKLSLAIGKSGQNVRLAAKLTDFKIDIMGR